MCLLRVAVTTGSPSKGSPSPAAPKIESRFMVNCRVCKSLGKEWPADLWNRRVGETQHTEERFGDN